MKIKLTECVAIKGRPTLPGTIVDLPSAEAASLVRRKMAVTTEDGVPKEAVFLDTTAADEPESKPKQRRK